MRGGGITLLTIVCFSVHVINHQFSKHVCSTSVLLCIDNKALNKCPFDVTQEQTQTGRAEHSVQLQRLGVTGSKKVSSLRTVG